MKLKWLLFVSLCIYSLSLFSQKRDKILFKCIYAEAYGKDINSKKQDKMLLVIGENSSAFYSLYEWKADSITDKMLKEGRSYEEIRAELSKYPRSYQNMQIYKHYPEKGSLTYIDRLLSEYKYTEKMMLPSWKILPEEKIITGYKCQQAEAQLYGRKWIVWFAPDIPLKEGPWKLWGLPGLILEAADSENLFHFTCIGMENVNSDTEVISLPKRKYVTCTRKEFIQAEKECLNDPDGYVYKIMGVKPVSYDVNGNVIKPTEKELFYIEKE